MSAGSGSGPGLDIPSAEISSDHPQVEGNDDVDKINSNSTSANSSSNINSSYSNNDGLTAGAPQQSSTVQCSSSTTWTLDWTSKQCGDRLIQAAEVILNNYFMINLNGSQRWRKSYLYQLNEMQRGKSKSTSSSSATSTTAIFVKVADLITLFKINTYFHSDILAALIIRFHPLAYDSYISKKRALIEALGNSPFTQISMDKLNGEFSVKNFVSKGLFSDQSEISMSDFQAYFESEEMKYNFIVFQLHSSNILKHDELSFMRLIGVGSSNSSSGSSSSVSKLFNISLDVWCSIYKKVGFHSEGITIDKLSSQISTKKAEKSIATSASPNNNPPATSGAGLAHNVVFDCNYFEISSKYYSIILNATTFALHSPNFKNDIFDGRTTLALINQSMLEIAHLNSYVSNFCSTAIMQVQIREEEEDEDKDEEGSSMADVARMFSNDIVSRITRMYPEFIDCITHPIRNFHRLLPRSHHIIHLFLDLSAENGSNSFQKYIKRSKLFSYFAECLICFKEDNKEKAFYDKISITFMQLLSPVCDYLYDKDSQAMIYLFSNSLTTSSSSSLRNRNIGSAKDRDPFVSIDLVYNFCFPDGFNLFVETQYGTFKITDSAHCIGPCDMNVAIFNVIKSKLYDKLQIIYNTRELASQVLDKSLLHKVPSDLVMKLRDISMKFSDKSFIFDTVDEGSTLVVYSKLVEDIESSRSLGIHKEERLKFIQDSSFIDPTLNSSSLQKLVSDVADANADVQNLNSSVQKRSSESKVEFVESVPIQIKEGLKFKHAITDLFRWTKAEICDYVEDELELKGYRTLFEYHRVNGLKFASILTCRDAAQVIGGNQNLKLRIHGEKIAIHAEHLRAIALESHYKDTLSMTPVIELSTTSKSASSKFNKSSSNFTNSITTSKFYKTQKSTSNNGQLKVKFIEWSPVDLASVVFCGLNKRYPRTAGIALKANLSGKAAMKMSRNYLWNVLFGFENFGGEVIKKENMKNEDEGLQRYFDSFNSMLFCSFLDKEEKVSFQNFSKTETDSLYSPESKENQENQVGAALGAGAIANPKGKAESEKEKLVKSERDTYIDALNSYENMLTVVSLSTEASISTSEEENLLSSSSISSTILQSIKAYKSSAYNTILVETRSVFDEICKLVELESIRIANEIDENLNLNGVFEPADDFKSKMSTVASFSGLNLDKSSVLALDNSKNKEIDLDISKSASIKSKIVETDDSQDLNVIAASSSPAQFRFNSNEKQPTSMKSRLLKTSSSASDENAAGDDDAIVLSSSNSNTSASVPAQRQLAARVIKDEALKNDNYNNDDGEEEGVEEEADEDFSEANRKSSKGGKKKRKSKKGAQRRSSKDILASEVDMEEYPEALRNTYLNHISKLKKKIIEQAKSLDKVRNVLTDLTEKNENLQHAKQLQSKNIKDLVNRNKVDTENNLNAINFISDKYLDEIKTQKVVLKTQISDQLLGSLQEKGGSGNGSIEDGKQQQRQQQQDGEVIVNLIAEQGEHDSKGYQSALQSMLKESDILPHNNNNESPLSPQLSHIDAYSSNMRDISAAVIEDDRSDKEGFADWKIIFESKKQVSVHDLKSAKFKESIISKKGVLADSCFMVSAPKGGLTIDIARGLFEEPPKLNSPTSKLGKNASSNIASATATHTALSLAEKKKMSKMTMQMKMEHMMNQEIHGFEEIVERYKYREEGYNKIDITNTNLILRRVAVLWHRLGYTMIYDVKMHKSGVEFVHDLTRDCLLGVYHCAENVVREWDSSSSGGSGGGGNTTGVFLNATSTGLNKGKEANLSLVSIVMVFFVGLIKKLLFQYKDNKEQLSFMLSKIREADFKPFELSRNNVQRLFEQVIKIKFKSWNQFDAVLGSFEGSGGGFLSVQSVMQTFRSLSNTLNLSQGFTAPPSSSTSSSSSGYLSYSNLASTLASHNDAIGSATLDPETSQYITLMLASLAFDSICEDSPVNLDDNPNIAVDNSVDGNVLRFIYKNRHIESFQLFFKNKKKEEDSPGDEDENSEAAEIAKFDSHETYNNFMMIKAINVMSDFFYYLSKQYFADAIPDHADSPTDHQPMIFTKKDKKPSRKNSDKDPSNKSIDTFLIAQNFSNILMSASKVSLSSSIAVDSVMKTADLSLNNTNNNTGNSFASASSDSNAFDKLGETAQRSNKFVSKLRDSTSSPFALNIYKIMNIVTLIRDVYNNPLISKNLCRRLSYSLQIYFSQSLNEDDEKKSIISGDTVISSFSTFVITFLFFRRQCLMLLLNQQQNQQQFTHLFSVISREALEYSLKVINHKIALNSSNNAVPAATVSISELEYMIGEMCGIVVPHKGRGYITKCQCDVEIVLSKIFYRKFQMKETSSKSPSPGKKRAETASALASAATNNNKEIDGKLSTSFASVMKALHEEVVKDISDKNSDDLIDSMFDTLKSSKPTTATTTTTSSSEVLPSPPKSRQQQQQSSLNNTRTSTAGRSVSPNPLNSNSLNNSSSKSGVPSAQNAHSLFQAAVAGKDNTAAGSGSVRGISPPKADSIANMNDQINKKRLTQCSEFLNHLTHELEIVKGFLHTLLPLWRQANANSNSSNSDSRRRSSSPTRADLQNSPIDTHTDDPMTHANTSLLLSDKLEEITTNFTKDLLKVGSNPALQNLSNRVGKIRRSAAEGVIDKSPQLTALLSGISGIEQSIVQAKSDFSNFSKSIKEKLTSKVHVHVPPEAPLLVSTPSGGNK